jgi:hypothetical protein
MAGVIHVQWYATVMRQYSFAEEVVKVAPHVLRYGATQYAVHTSRDDRYKVTQMSWFERKADWYRYWEGPEMIEFRARLSGHYTIPIIYVWQDELIAGALGPQVPNGEAEPEPAPVQPAAAQ